MRKEKMRHLWLNYGITNDSSMHVWWAPKRTWNLGKIWFFFAVPLVKVEGWQPDLVIGKQPIEVYGTNAKFHGHVCVRRWWITLFPAFLLCWGSPEIWMYLWNLYSTSSRWWFLKYFLFSPLLGEDSHFDEYFSKGLKPPTSHQFSVIGFCWLNIEYPNKFPTKLWLLNTPINSQLH